MRYRLRKWLLIMEASPNKSGPWRFGRFAVRVRLSLIVPQEHRQEMQDKLCVYFQSKQGGDCRVEDIRFLGEDMYGSWFRVAFSEPCDAGNILARPDHAMDIGGFKISIEVEVQDCQALPGTSVSSSSEKSQVKLEPVKDDSQHRSSWLNWEKEAVYNLNDCKTTRVPVQQSLWKDAVDKLTKITTTCSMVQDAQLHEVILVGEQKDVDNAEAEIVFVIKELQKEPKYDAQQAKEDIYWDSEKLHLFNLCGIKQEIEKFIPALKISFFSSSYGKTGISLNGTRETIRQAEQNIRRMMDNLEKTEFNAGRIKVRFVQLVLDKIHEALGSQDIHAACSGSDDGKITIHGATSRDVRAAKAYIDNEIDEVEIFIEGQSALAVLQSHHGKRLWDLITNHMGDRVLFSHETGARFVSLAGYKRHLDETKRYIIQFIKENDIRTTIPLNQSKIRLITTYCGQELEKVRCQHSVEIQPQMSGWNRGLSIQGNKEGLEAVRQLVTSLVEAVKEKQYPVSKTGMARLFREEKGMRFLECVEKEFQCVITTDSQEESDDEEEEEGAGHASTAALRPIPVALPDPVTETPRLTVSGLNVVTREGMTIKMTKGSIALEVVDVIVNTVGSDMNLTTGKVCQAISNAAGPTLQRECNTWIAFQGNVAAWSFVETGPGFLACKKIYHCVCRGYKQSQSEQLLKKIVLELMVCASGNGMTSMAIPAIGTGNLNYPPAVTAHCMYEAAFEFSSQHPNGYLKDVRFVVYDNDMNTIKGFVDKIHHLDPSSGAIGGTSGRGTGNRKKTLRKKNKSEAGVENDKREKELQETVILQLCALGMSSLMKASDKLDRFQEEEFLSEDFKDEMGLIDKMTTEHKAELKQIGRKHDVYVTMEPSKERTKFIHVEGCKFNVKDALLDISQMFTRIQRIKHVSKEVKWKYDTPSGNEDYDEEVNAILEEAYQKKKLNVTLDLEEGLATIYFQQMQEILNGSVINVHRVDLKSGPLAARIELPSNWKPMKQGESTKMVKLTAGTPEYTTVETKFQASVRPSAFNIVEIQRVQNQGLMMQYQARKVVLQNLLKRNNFEKVLYHGTDEQTSKKISSHGFNRSFCGKNAAVYGNGTYFAAAASYSAHRQYAQPDGNGIKHIFMSNVLVGDYVQGSHGMITPPNKPQSPGELYDSVVDNINSPGIYVIFHDAQAYPEYLIKFRDAV